MTISRPLSWTAYLGIAIAAATLTEAAMAQSIPESTNEAALYEVAKKEGKVTFYHGGPPEPMKNISNSFEKKYPGITVELVRLVGPRMYQRVSEETRAGQYIADVIHTADYPSMVAMVNQKIIAPWKVPTSDRFDDQYKIKNSAYSPILDDIIVTYNTQKLSPEEIKLLRTDWRSVTDPRFKGRFAVSTLACGICYAGVQMFLALPEYGPEFLKKVAAQQPRVFTSTVAGLDRVVAGELDFIFWSSESLSGVKWKSGAPIEWAHPGITPLFPNMWQGVAEKAPHPHAARLFQNWMFSEEGARAHQEYLNAPATMSGVPDDRAVTKEKWYQPIKNVYRVDFARWEKSFDDDMKVWIDMLKQSH